MCSVIEHTFTSTLGIAIVPGCVIQAIIVLTVFLLSIHGPGHLSLLPAQPLPSSQSQIKAICVDTMSSNPWNSGFAWCMLQAKGTS